MQLLFFPSVGWAGWLAVQAAAAGTGITFLASSLAPISGVLAYGKQQHKKWEKQQQQRRHCVTYTGRKGQGQNEELSCYG